MNTLHAHQQRCPTVCVSADCASPFRQIKQGVHCPADHCCNTPVFWTEIQLADKSHSHSDDHNWSFSIIINQAWLVSSQRPHVQETSQCDRHESNRPVSSTSWVSSLHCKQSLNSKPSSAIFCFQIPAFTFCNIKAHSPNLPKSLHLYESFSLSLKSNELKTIVTFFSQRNREK